MKAVKADRIKRGCFFIIGAVLFTVFGTAFLWRVRISTQNERVKKTQQPEQPDLIFPNPQKVIDLAPINFKEAALQESIVPPPTSPRIRAIHAPMERQPEKEEPPRS